MGAVGVVAEYDPFHLGHQYQLQETKKLVEQELPIVCVMSGNWGQRGTCTLTDKWTRAGLALRGGADLVLELPVWHALSSAEGFARGAVSLLLATGVVDTLSFGSECGNVEWLEALAACLDSPACQEHLRRKVRKGTPFARARQEAVQEVAGRELADLLTFPNNNLGVEYLRARNAAGRTARTVTVSRRGAPHDSAHPEDGFASASYLRDLARSGDWEGVAAWTPVGTAEILRRAGVADMRRVERAILARLRCMDERDFAALPDSGRAEGLPARLVHSAHRAGSLEEFYSLAKTKRISHARLRRLTARAFLGLSSTPEAVYLRVLGMNARGMEVLKQMKRVSALPLLTKPAHIRRLGREAERQFETECRATDLYGLCLEEVRPCGLDYTTGPIIERSGFTPAGSTSLCR